MDEFDSWKAHEALSWLRYVRSEHLKTVALQDEIDVMRSLALSGQDTTREKVQQQPRDQVAEAASRLIEMTREFCAQLATIADISWDAHSRLMRLEDARYTQVLVLYYVDGNTWAAVADKMGYEPETCMGLRTEALPYVWDVMPAEWRTAIPRAD